MNKKMPEWLGKKRLYNKNFSNINGDVIHWDVLKIEKSKNLKIRFISTNSKHRQGIHMRFFGKDGTITTNKTMSDSFDFWEDTCPKEFSVDCESKGGYLSIYNIFEEVNDSGRRRYEQMDSCGMILEQHDNIYRYRCNDVGFKSDFDKLIFELEVL